MNPQPSVQRPPTLYAELHAHSSFTFSHSAATPQYMVETAWKAGLSTIALLERDGLYSAVQVAETVHDLTEDMQAGLLPIRPPLGTAFGAELTLSSTHQRHDPTAEIVPILVRNVDGYRALSHLIGEAYLRAGDKDHVHYYQSELLDFVRAGHCWVLTGGPGSLLRRALDGSGVTAAAAELTRCVTRYGADNVLVELVYSGRMGECERNDALVEICENHHPPVAYIATSCPAMGTPHEGKTAAAVQALGAYRTVEENAGYIHPGGAAFLHTPSEMSTLAGPHQQALTTAARIGAECAFNLHLVSPGLPPFPVPPGEDENSYLRTLTLAGAQRRYCGKDIEEAALRQIDYELEIIRQLDFPATSLSSTILSSSVGTTIFSVKAEALPPTLLSATVWALRPSTPPPTSCFLSVSSRQREMVRQILTSISSRSGEKTSSSTSTSATDVATPHKSLTSLRTADGPQCAMLPVPLDIPQGNKTPGVKK